MGILRVLRGEQKRVSARIPNRGISGGFTKFQRGFVGLMGAFQEATWVFLRPRKSIGFQKAF